MSEMVKRVALAFAGLHITTASGVVVSAEDVARAAIEAMLAPTPEMHGAGNHLIYVARDESGCGAIWQAMIDEALK